MFDFHTRTENVICEIQALIDNKEGRPRYMSDDQLESIKRELREMDKVKDKKVFYPYYPKCIVDCWDFQDALGTQLMDLLKLYCLF